MSEQPAAAYIWNRFTTPNLAIDVSLSGAVHQFTFRDRAARVELPTRSTADPPEHSRLVVSRRLASDDSPLSFLVSDVDVCLDETDGALVEQLAAGELGGPLVGDRGRDAYFDAAAEKALGAFDYWLRVVRWCTKRSEIGRLAKRSRSTWGTYLRDCSTHRSLSAGTTVIRVGADRPLSPAMWAGIQLKLADGLSSPLFYDLFFDGLAQLSEEDYRRAIIDFTSACEVALKMLLERILPANTIGPARKHLLRAPVSTLLRDFGPSLLGVENWAKLSGQKACLLELFAARNSVVHGHETHVISRARCAEFSGASERLITLAGDVLEQAAASRGSGNGG